MVRQLMGVYFVGIVATVLICLGWLHLFPLFRQAGPVMFVGWGIGILGLMVLYGVRSWGSARLRVGLLLSLLGLTLLALPQDGQGILTGLRVGYAGALLSTLPHLWRVLKVSRGLGRKTMMASRKDA